MKVSLLKIARKKEVIKRLELSELAEMIRKNPEEGKVFNLRLNYQFNKPKTSGRPKPATPLLSWLTSDETTNFASRTCKNEKLGKFPS